MNKKNVLITIITVIVSFTLCWLMQDIFYPKLPAEQIDSLINTADDKYYSEDYINAERLYKHIIKVSGTSSSYELLNRSHAKLQIKDYEGAIKDFDNAIEIDLQHGCDNECYIGHAGAYSTMISIIAQNLYTELDKKDKSSEVLENIESKLLMLRLKRIIKKYNKTDIAKYSALYPCEWGSCLIDKGLELYILEEYEKALGYLNKAISEYQSIENVEQTNLCQSIVDRINKVYKK